MSCIDSVSKLKFVLYPLFFQIIPTALVQGKVLLSSYHIAWLSTTIASFRQLVSTLVLLTPKYILYILLINQNCQDKIQLLTIVWKIRPSQCSCFQLSDLIENIGNS